MGNGNQGGRALEALAEKMDLPLAGEEPGEDSAEGCRRGSGADGV